MTRPILICFWDYLLHNGLLSGCITSETVGETFSFRIFLYRAEFMIPSVRVGHPVPEQPQIITLPLPCMTVSVILIFMLLVLCQSQLYKRSKKCLSCEPTEYLPKIYMIIKVFLVIVLVSSGCTLETLPCRLFRLVSYY